MRAGRPARPVAAPADQAGREFLATVAAAPGQRGPGRRGPGQRPDRPAWPVRAAPVVGPWPATGTGWARRRCPRRGHRGWWDCRGVCPIRGICASGGAPAGLDRWLGRRVHGRLPECDRPGQLGRRQARRLRRNLLAGHRNPRQARHPGRDGGPRWHRPPGLARPGHRPGRSRGPGGGLGGGLSGSRAPGRRGAGRNGGGCGPGPDRRGLPGGRRRGRLDLLLLFFRPAPDPADDDDLVLLGQWVHPAPDGRLAQVPHLGNDQFR